MAKSLESQLRFQSYKKIAKHREQFDAYSLSVLSLISNQMKANEWILGAENVFVETALTSLTFGPQSIELLLQCKQLTHLSLIKVRLLRFTKSVEINPF